MAAPIKDMDFPIISATGYTCFISVTVTSWLRLTLLHDEEYSLKVLLNDAESLLPCSQKPVTRS
jgi:hypothetical protein